MAEITIKVGAVTATRTFPDNAKFNRVLGLFANWFNVDANLPAQQRLEAVIDAMVRFIVERARSQHVRATSKNAEVESEGIDVT